MDWLFPLDDLENSSYPEFYSHVGALAMGSSTYEWIVRNAERVSAEAGSPWPYSLPTWVFSKRRHPLIKGADITFVRGEVTPIHEAMRLAADNKTIWIVGGGDLAGQFYDAGLLDELIVQVGSLTLGTGKPLFPRKVLNPTLQLTSVQRMGKEMVELRYALSK